MDSWRTLNGLLLLHTLLLQVAQQPVKRLLVAVVVLPVPEVADMMLAVDVLLERCGMQCESISCSLALLPKNMIYIMALSANIVYNASHEGGGLALTALPPLFARRNRQTTHLGLS